MKSRGLLIAHALIGLLASSSAIGHSASLHNESLKPGKQRRESATRQYNGFGGYSKSTGISVAQCKRNAVKARNVRRNKRAHGGAA